MKNKIKTFIYNKNITNKRCEANFMSNVTSVKHFIISKK